MPRKKVVKKRDYTDAQKRAACLEYYLCGSMNRVSRDTGYPLSTLRTWKKTEWWGEAMIEFRNEYDDEIEAKLGEIMRLAHGHVLKGLTEGDEKLVYNPSSKKHEKVKVMPSSKDAAVIAAVAFDKRRITLNQPTAISSNTGGMEALVNKFNELARSNREKKINASIKGEFEEVTDG
jgi:hypothetical protein